MKFLIDAQLSPALCRWFRAAGYDTVHVSDLLRSDASDLAIGDQAYRHDRVIVSKDRDFLPIVARLGVRMLWLRCGNLRPRPMLEWLNRSWADAELRLLDGEQVVEVH